jgi:hypothetical protein
LVLTPWFVVAGLLTAQALTRSNQRKALVAASLASLAQLFLLNGDRLRALRRTTISECHGSPIKAEPAKVVRHFCSLRSFGITHITEGFVSLRLIRLGPKPHER